MKNSLSIKSLFFKRMAYSAIIQFIIIAIILIISKDYLQNTQINTITKDIIISDAFTTEEISQYRILKNSYALDLALYNLENERKLDSIKFVSADKINNYLNESCKPIGNLSYRLCNFPNNQLLGITTLWDKHKVLGYIIATKKYNSFLFLSLSSGLLAVLLVVIGIFLFNIIFVILFMTKKVEKTTYNLLNFILSKNRQLFPTSCLEISEFRQIAEKFAFESKAREHLQQENAYFEASKNIAQQVAHDIRSPLAVLTLLTKNYTNTESQRLLMSQATSRIDEVANNLLVQNRKNSRNKNLSNTVEWVIGLITEIILEKKILYQTHNVNLSLESDISSYKSFVFLCGATFKRILSNILNNSYEAMINVKNGNIKIKLDTKDNNIYINIVDNGIGLTGVELERILSAQRFSTKENGHGLGLTHAIKTIRDEWGGSLTMNSIKDKGTSTLVSLKLTKEPDWFLSALRLTSMTNVVILSADEMIYHAWKTKLKPHLSLDKVLYFNNYHKFISHYQNTDLTTYFIIDLNITDNENNGYQIINELNLQSNSILLTDSFKDLQLRANCTNKKIRMVLKEYISLIPITMA